MIPKILLVDDREDNLLSMETILESENYQFCKSDFGQTGIKNIADPDGFCTDPDGCEHAQPEWV